jgi:3'-phosphoadenosine 5'-phosphosulfate sulfotransferase (PAPS reductase)/FAD synthetase
MFTTALIAGDAVILDALHKTGLLNKVPVVFVDTFTLFPESISHLREVENHYGFKVWAVCKATIITSLLGGIAVGFDVCVSAACVILIR